MLVEGNAEEMNGFYVFLIVFGILGIVSYGSYKFGYSYTETARLKAQNNCMTQQNERVDKIEEKVDKLESKLKNSE